MKAAVWDFNGIVVDDVEAHRAAFNATIGMFGIAPVPTIEAIQRITDVPYIKGLEAVGLTREAFSTKNTDGMYHGVYMRSPEAYQLRPGVRHSLDWLKANGWTNILLSNTRPDVLRVQLAALGLTNSFAWICGDKKRKDVAVKFTKAKRLKEHFKNHHSDVLSGIMIGDSMEEPAVARELGFTSIAVTGGWFDRDRLAAANPDHLTDSIRTVPSIVRSLRAA